jgi:hypothetical protein
VGYLVTASPTITHTPTATTIAIDARGPMGEADVGLTQQLAQIVAIVVVGILTWLFPLHYWRARFMTALHSMVE